MIVTAVDVNDDVKTRIAWLYYVEGMTQDEVANLVGMNRSRVLRILAAARQDGTVQIRVTTRLSRCVGQSCGSSGSRRPAPCPVLVLQGGLAQAAAQSAASVAVLRPGRSRPPSPGRISTGRGRGCRNSP
jgi:DNA-binding transcriptional regulator LsrR (DeoR family)